jgi:hypothetical protein
VDWLDPKPETYQNSDQKMIHFKGYLPDSIVPFELRLVMKTNRCAYASWRLWGLMVSLILGNSWYCFAHRPFESYIQHHSQIEIGVENIDIIHQLIFFHNEALGLRRAIDANKDRMIDADELEAFLAKKRRELSMGMYFQEKDKKVHLTELYKPDIDLLADQRVAPSPIELTCYLFMRLKPTKDEFVLSNLFYPETAAVWSWDLVCDEQLSLKPVVFPFRKSFQKSPVIFSPTINAVSRTIKINLNQEKSQKKGSGS